MKDGEIENFRKSDLFLLTFSQKSLKNSIFTNIYIFILR